MKTQDRTIRDECCKNCCINKPRKWVLVLDANDDPMICAKCGREIELKWVKQPEKQEIEKLSHFGATNEAWLRLLTRKLDEVIDVVNKLLKE